MKMKVWSTFVLLGLSWCLDLTSAFAEESDYNFSWLDPDKKIYVLQNRRYRKADTPELYLLGGTSLGDPYRTVFQVQPRFGYWFSESMGLELFYSSRFHSTNTAYQALVDAISKSTNAYYPYIREVNSQFGALFNWAPWYAKINVFNSVLYFDWYLSMGAGLLQTQIGQKTKDDAVTGRTWSNEDLFAVYLGTGHLYHLDERWTVRLDFLGHFYSANVYGPGTTDKAIYSNFAFNLGLGYRL